jgi:hypothetical protein
VEGELHGKVSREVKNLRAKPNRIKKQRKVGSSTSPCKSRGGVGALVMGKNLAPRGGGARGLIDAGRGRA